MRVKGREDNSRLQGETSPTVALDLTLVAATLDAEEALLTPSDIPGVGADPVLDTTFLTIADQLDSVTTLKGTALVVVDTTSIAHEIGINTESNLEGTVGGKLNLVGGLTDDGVGLGTLVLVTVPVKGSVASALLLALRGDDLAGVVTSGVRIALISHNTMLDPVAPGAGRVTTIAGTAAGEKATGTAVHILSRKTDDLVLGNADTIAHRLNGTESPAGTAVLLVADLLHGSALGPGLTRIESHRGSSDLLSRELGLSPGESAHVVKVDTKKGTSLTLGHTSDVVVSSPPGGLTGIDLTDHFGADSDLLSEGDCSNKGKSNNELVHCHTI